MDTCPDCGAAIVEPDVRCQQLGCRVARLDKAAAVFSRADPTWDVTPQSWNLAMAELDAYQEDAKRQRAAAR